MIPEPAAPDVAPPPQGAWSDLGAGERLLIGTFRRIVAGFGACPLIAHEFSKAYGEDAAEMFATFCVFVASLGRAGRHRIQVGRPGGMLLTGDESQLLALIAAAQTGDRTLFEAHLSWLARGQAQRELTMAVNAVASGMAQHGFWFAQPVAGRAPSHGGLRYLAPRLAVVT